MTKIISNSDNNNSNTKDQLYNYWNYKIFNKIKKNKIFSQNLIIWLYNKVKRHKIYFFNIDF